MGTFQKFLFETSFDPEKIREAKARAAAEAEAATAPPVPTFSEEEMAAAREAAFAEGKAAGLAEAEDSDSRHLLNAVTALPPQIETLARHLDALESERRREALNAAITVVRKLFPRLASASGLEEIRTVVEACLERLREEPRLVIRCADRDLDALKAQIEECAAKGSFEGKLVFLADDDIASGNVRVEWADGGAERDVDGLWKEIDAVIARAVAPAESSPETPSQPRADVEPLRRAQIA